MTYYRRNESFVFVLPLHLHGTIWGFMFLSLNTFAGNGELVPKKGLGPLDKAKVHEVQAQSGQRWNGNRDGR